MRDSGACEVWIIDDSAACRRLVAMVVTRAGATPREFESAESLVALLAGHVSAHLWPSAILTDLNMGEMDGLALAAVLRARGYPGPLAMMTGASDDALRDATREAGIDVIIDKAVLVERVSRFAESVTRAHASRRAS